MAPHSYNNQATVVPVPHQRVQWRLLLLKLLCRAPHLQVKVFNDLPADFPQVADGITLHFHGFYMWDNASWYDGTPFITQCPVAPGKHMMFDFLVRGPTAVSVLWGGDLLSDLRFRLHGYVGCACY